MIRQTDSAMRMLESAYKSVLTNCYIKENLTGGVKHLIKGVALTSLVASFLSLPFVAANAAEIKIEAFVEKADPATNTITVNEDTVVIGNGKQSGDSFDTGHYDKNNNSLYSDASTINSVEVTNSSSLTFKDVALDCATINTNGALTIINESDGMRGGLFVVGDITADSLKIDTSKSSGSKGIYAITDVANIAIPSGMEKEIAVTVRGDLSVTSAQDGVFTEGNKPNSIYLTSTEGNITISAADRGAVYNNVGTEADGTKNNLSIIAEAGNISIASGDKSEKQKYGGVINKNEGTTTVIAENGKVSVSSNTQGVYSTAGKTEIKSKQNQISAGTDGVVMEGGTVTLTAESGTSQLARTTQEDVVNVIHGDDNGINIKESDEDAEFIAIADKDNYVGGKTNGILVNNSKGNVELTAKTGSNYIGFNADDNLYDENGELIDDDYIGKKGINVTAGTIQLSASKENVIKAKEDGIHAKGEFSQVKLTEGDTSIVVNNNDENYTRVHGILAEKNSKIDIEDAIDIDVDKTVESILPAKDDIAGIANYGSSIQSQINNGSIVISVNLNSTNNSSLSSGIITSNCIGLANGEANIFSNANTHLEAESFDISSSNINGATHAVYVNSRDKEESKNFTNKLDIIATTGDIKISSSNIGNTGVMDISGVRVNGNSSANIISQKGTVSISATSEKSYASGVEASGSTVGAASINISGVNTNISGGYAAISVVDYSGMLNDTNISVTATSGNNTLTASQFFGILAQNGTTVNVTALQGKNEIYSPYGIYTQANNLEKSNIEFDANVNSINSSSTGIYAENGHVLLRASNSSDGNEIHAGGCGIQVSAVSDVVIEALEGNNLVTSGDIIQSHGVEYATKYAIHSTGGSSVSVKALAANKLFGSVYASGNGSSVTLSGLDNGAAESNLVSSYAYISDAGDMQSNDVDESFKDKQVISALYAEEGASISLTGNSNILRTYAVSTETNDLERVVWAYNGETFGTSINIDGYTSIATDSYDASSNSTDIAIAAGTAVNLDATKVADSKDMPVDDRAKVILTYADTTDSNGNIVKSSISGDILAAYEGYVDIKSNDSSAGIKITGNLLAGNNGILNVDLGSGGTLTGRADDYGDAGAGDNSQGNFGHQSSTFFNPAFSSAIYEGGAVNLTMGEGSVWNVTGQSWITSITTNQHTTTETDSAYTSYDVTGLPTINLVQANHDLNASANALTVYKFDGDAVFSMNLDGNDLDKSNMLYMKQANGTYYINLQDTVSADEINTDLHDGLRFATVGAGSNVAFHVGSIDNGVFNVEYDVGTDNYDKTVDENQLYNGSTLTNEKPGDSTVSEFFSNSGTPVAENQGSAENGIATANAAIMTLAEVEPQAETADTATNAVNHKIIAVKSTEMSDIGKTVIDMSRANYANAVYMDTLNKRQGEARFVGDTDHGVWVRLRHDNIGKEDSFRSHNTMVEVGFDQRDILESGEFHTGFALDYMNGDLDYHTVDGDGDIERYGIWFYTTYLADDGQYLDLVLKYGHLKNDFGFNTRTQGEHVSGDYTNETASLSAEYGWKFSNSYNYYIEPQAQLQYTYVTGADYTTSQGSKVDLDSIHSLIGRVGFRAGKDFLDWEHPVTMYARADVLHEFLGDQDIRAYDDTGVMDVTYENDDTWYTVGLGMSVKSSENTYFFIEGETALGADNEDTYTLSGGFKHSF